MTVRFRKKTSRQRGEKTHGWGSKKKHRGAGSRGGRGQAGMLKHKKSWMIKNAPNHFGRTGFRQPTRKKQSSINLIKLDSMNGNEFDLKKIGYNKLLSTGKITRAVTVTVENATPKAIKKIEDVGGKVIIPDKIDQ